MVAHHLLRDRGKLAAAWRVVERLDAEEKDPAEAIGDGGNMDRRARIRRGSSR